MGELDVKVCLLGMGIVFLGLICLVLLCYIMSFLYRVFSSKSTESAKADETKPIVNQDIPNRQEFVAAVSAAIAEDMGKDISAVRILSIKKM